MLTGLLHRVVARPWVYDLAQTLAGAKAVRRRLAYRIQPLRAAPLVLDIGGGTGAVGDLWDCRRTRYVCLDIDPLKLAGFVARNPSGLAVQADAARIPLADACVDVVLCTNVTHHLTDPLLDRMIAEAARVLKPAGKFVLSDALWVPSRRAGRIIWHYDRGSFPRTAAALQTAVSTHLGIESWEQFSIWHEYFISIAGPR
jgi:SAM-dependent methyltransferase